MTLTHQCMRTDPLDTVADTRNSKINIRRTTYNLELARKQLCERRQIVKPMSQN
jgi:hypothetical protein